MVNEENTNPIDDSTEQEQTIENETPVDNQIDELQNLKNQLQESNDKFLRLYAEFDNYKRRTIKERAELLQSAGKDVIISVLPIIDDFERAIKANENIEDVQSIKDGIELIYNKLLNNLNTKGLSTESSIGKEFNADIHEAITTIPAPEESMKGKIIDEIEKGYKLNGAVIRFAKVIIGE